MNAATLFLIATGSFQAMSYSTLVDEGREVGRLGAASGVCATVGYTVNELVAEHAAADFSRRAKKSGWRDDEIEQAIGFGVTQEHSGLNLDRLALADTPDALRRYVESTADHIASRCREVAVRHPGSVRDFETGDRALRAALTHALRNLYQPPFASSEQHP